MQHFSASPGEMVASLWRNRTLVYQMTKREAVGRYKGSLMGLAWSFVNPLFMLVIYTFVFSVVFKARWGINTEESKADFAIILFVGMILHGLFAECINRAPSLIVGNVNYVKKVIFPLEILPWVALGSTLFHTFTSLIILMLAQLVLDQHIPATTLFLPFILLPLILGTMGLSWFLAALGVYLRDVSQLTGIFTTVMLFVSGVFFPLHSLPEKYQFWLKLNPLAVLIEQARQVLVFGQMPDMTMWLIMLATGSGLAWTGFAWFQKTRKGFADVL